MLHYFLWDFPPCVIVHVSPSVIISKAAVETKGLLQTSNHLSTSVEKHSPQITCSTVIYDVIVSTFPVCITGAERQIRRETCSSTGASHARCTSCHTRAHRLKAYIRISMETIFGIKD